MIHARDYLITASQKRTTTVCFKRVKASRTVYLDSGLPFDCVGCRAIVAERRAEARNLVPRWRELWRRGQAARQGK